MIQEKVWREFITLPLNAQEQVAGFAFLRTRYKQPRYNPRTERCSLTGEILVGMWRNRQDMQNSSAWVRSARKREWARMCWIN